MTVTSVYPEDANYWSQCEICQKYIRTREQSGLKKAINGHMRGHVRRGEAVIKRTWVNNRVRGSGHVAVWYEAVQGKP